MAGLARAVGAVLGDLPAARAAARADRERVIADFSLDGLVRSLDELYRRELGRCMCGIAGALAFGAGRPGRADEQLRRMAHRGPDADGVFERGEGWVGQTRLSIIDLARGDPPIANEAGTIGVALNGEIYNYRELRAGLRARGHTLATDGDTEVIAHLAEELEPAALATALEGMFAIAAWDEPRGRLVLARDRFGKKPLYYFHDGRRLVFGSEIKSVLAHPHVPRELRADVIPDYLTFGYVPTPDTFYAGIQSVPPGHVLVASTDGEVRLERYWGPRWPGARRRRGARRRHARRAGRRGPPPAARRRQRRLVADVPLGAFLSGGIDSSAVVGLMSELQAAPVQDVHDRLRGRRRLRRAAVRASRRRASRHRAHGVRRQARRRRAARAPRLAPRPAVRRLERAADVPAQRADQPARDRRAVRRRRRRAVRRLRALRRRARARALRARRAAGRAQRAGRARRGRARAARRSRAARSCAARSCAATWRAAGAAGLGLLRLGRGPPRARRARCASRGEAAYERIWERSAGAHPLDRLLDLNLRTYLLDDLLPKVDRMAMAHGLEVRSPFLDRELAEYAFTLAPSARLRVRDMSLKRILKTAVADLLPAGLLDRPKQGFGVPLDRWFRDELVPLVDGMLCAPDARVGAHMSRTRPCGRWPTSTAAAPRTTATRCGRC